MLKLECSPPNFMTPVQSNTAFSTTRRMPVDFTSYLLSSSPPGFDFYSLRDQFSVGGTTQGRNGCGAVKPTIIQVQRTWDKGIQDKACDKDNAESTQNGVNENNHNGSEAEEDIENTQPKSNMGKKKVSFADELGKSLIAVRILTEPSDMPPRIRPEILSTLTQGFSAGVTVTPPLVLTFKQPASDYLAFRERLESNFVSLENVILKDYNLLGTIKVKNISYEKFVKVRCTFDSWATSTDFPAQYVPCPSAGSSPFDTFSFEVDVPPNFDINKKIQFCVCYMANSQEFWDSNNGKNYGVVSADWESQETTDKLVTKDTNTIFSLGVGSDWTEYSSWNNTDSSVPYW